ncbi:DMT family transporter [Salinispirillum sp. LH 10-3-1]|uniref:DMT family transporter n=1 Tax=Salinispirillum sp. LH 10-3-1 TaxID=2952525 RepID=A0AB38YFY4_9GAMM
MTLSKNNTALAWFLLAATTLFWGGNFVLGRAVSAEIPPIALAWWRWVLAMAVILPFAAKGLWQVRAVLRREWRYLLLVSVLSVSVFNTFVYLGLQTSPATNALLLLSSGPVMILGFSWWLFSERINAQQVFGITLSLVGVIIIVTEGNPLALDALFAGGAGNLWILSAVIAWALYSVLLRKRPAEISGTVFFALTAVVGWLCLTPFFLFEHFVQGRVMVFNTTAALSIGYVGFFASVLAFLFWNRGIQMLGANRASNSIHLIPVWGLLLASVLLGERLLTFHWLGMGLIIAGILLASVLARRVASA